jgi:hypothetical protein
MSPEIIALIVIALVAIVLVGMAMFMRPQLKGRRLRRRFGPEYDRAVADHPSREAAERALLAREQRHSELNIRPLEPAAREHYRAEWTAIQERFVDDPRAAAAEADRLITSIMTEQGYPDEGYEQRVADLSVGHSRAVHHYRRAHEIGSRAARDGASTEDLRQALVHYRAIFDDVLGTRSGEPRAAESAQSTQSAQSTESAQPAQSTESTESTGRRR